MDWAGLDYQAPCLAFAGGKPNRDPCEMLKVEVTSACKLQAHACACLRLHELSGAYQKETGLMT